MTSKFCQNLPAGIEICLIKICLSSDQNPCLGQIGFSYASLRGARGRVPRPDARPKGKGQGSPCGE